MLVKPVAIVISLLKSTVLKSVRISLELPAYVQEAKFSYLPEETVLSCYKSVFRLVWL